MSSSPDALTSSHAPQPPQTAEIARALLVALPVGLVASAVAFAFLGAVHALQELIWHTLPQEWGFSAEAWWWLLLIPTLGGVLAGAAVLLLPGNGGHEPIEGFTPDPVQPNAIPSVVLAALASLTFGAVLGPEAPLVALGSALGLWLARITRLSEDVAPLAAAGGLFAAIASLFGNPLLGAFLVMEAVGMGGAGAPLVAVVLPGMLAAAAGYVLITGVSSWSGIEVSGLKGIDLPDYDTLLVTDVAWAVALGVVMAIVVAAVRAGAERMHAITKRHPWWAAPIAGFVIGALALVFTEITGQSADLVLFSGEESAPDVAANGPEWGAGVIALLFLFKAIVYAVSLASLFRGGPVFPAIFLGVALGVLLSDLVPSVSLTAGVVAGIAAGTSAMLGLPLSAVLLAVILGGSAAVDATSLALVASVVAFVVSRGLSRKRSQAASEPPG